MIKKLKTIGLSLLPIFAFVLIMHFFVQEIETEVFVNFFIGCGILILGQVVFLTGIENSIEPMGEFIGNSVSNNKRFYIYIIFAIIFGVVSTIAEPDMQVFSSTVVVAGYQINKFVFLIVAGIGVGTFIALALVRVALKFSFNITLFVAYLAVFVIAIFAGEDSLSLGLDAGANTTGVVTSPFLLALGVSIASITSGNKLKDEDGFGFIALSSVGPVLAIGVLMLFVDRSGNAISTLNEGRALWFETLLDVSLSIIPLVVIFFIFEAIFIKISRQEKKKLLFGSFITFIGFYLFLFGINFGLGEMGVALGSVLRNLNPVVIAVVCALLGFLIVFSEPSVRILANKIEETTNRNIRAPLVLTAIAISVMLAMVLCVLRIVCDISIWWYVGIIYGLAFLLMLVTPKLFVSMAFDSSGVATGTMTVAFLFPIITGLSGSVSGGFGTIAILSMTPIVVMEILGVVYRIVVSVDNRKTAKLLVSLSRTEDKFSNIGKLKVRHEELLGR